MSDWKTYKDQYPWSVGENDWKKTQSQVPWECDRVLDKIVYNEGDRFASILNPVFDVEYRFSGVPITVTHKPDAYWSRDYASATYAYFTSMPYPLVVEEEMALATVNLLKGDSLPHIREYSQLSNIELVTGIFKQTLKTYELTEAELISVDLVSGIFKCAMIAYSDWPVEETKLSFINLIAGSFRVSMINYENWPVEETKLTSIALTGGLHETS